MDARKTKYEAGDLEDLLDGARKVVVGKGKKFVVFEKDTLDASSAELQSAVLGRTGTLRAPAVRAGKTWVIGYSDAAWDEVFG